MDNQVRYFLRSLYQELELSAYYLPKLRLIRVNFTDQYKHDFCYFVLGKNGWMVKPKRFQKCYSKISKFLSQINQSIK